MTHLKLFLVIAVTWIVCFFYSSLLDIPVQKTKFQPGSVFANTERIYAFDVPENGSIMRFEVNGRLALQSWKSLELMVFGPDEQYLFTIKDELWAESGRDSDGRWTEYRDKIRISQRFPQKGQYTAILYDEKGPHRTGNGSEYYFRITALKGDSSILTLWLWILGIVLACYVFYGSNFLENKNDYKNFYLDKSSVFSGVSSLTIILVVVLPAIVLCVLASHKSDEPINWVYVSSSHKSISSDRQMREHSLGSAGFRTSGSRGGK
ncbi:hypothetical protein CWB96_21520 [Pseudoalteromonas citrea]|uniref:Uncharacterized protein n=1 Tax=Pseudoalteromonas citrea TaxID=43655 RepID=A0A5S3XH05_9GAMM|nr:hypothetical protein [Pseudoalteromonas citrea]TMP42359.1 hypothetical protein CWB97_12090 [Pseudoalteromonas citrea]TMP52819.1 hypothetical protein CWB96_21520 [Pseudoalteromonas citrea]